MKAITAIGIVIAVGGGGLYVHRYYKGIDTLQYGLNGLAMQGDEWRVELTVNNPTGFTYPVPALFFNVYDKAGNYYGPLHSTAMQFIKPGVNYLTAYLVPNFTTIIASLVHALLPGQDLELMFDGYITIAGYPVALKIPITQKLSS